MHVRQLGSPVPVYTDLDVQRGWCRALASPYRLESLQYGDDRHRGGRQVINLDARKIPASNGKAASQDARDDREGLGRRQIIAKPWVPAAAGVRGGSQSVRSESVIQPRGAARYGIETVPPIATRGILLDVPRATVLRVVIVSGFDAASNRVPQALPVLRCLSSCLTRSL